MTGTDIMEQLDDIAFMIKVEDAFKPEHKIKPKAQRTSDDYTEMHKTIRKFYATHPTAKLQNIHFNNPHMPSTAELDKMCDHISAYKIKATVDKLNNITANIKLYKIEKDTVDLTQSKLREHSRNWKDIAL